MSKADHSWLQKCEDMVNGVEVAAIKRICMKSMSQVSGVMEGDLEKLRLKWCSDSTYKERVVECITTKLNTMPGRPVSTLAEIAPRRGDNLIIGSFSFPLFCHGYIVDCNHYYPEQIQVYTAEGSLTSGARAIASFL